MYVKLNHVRRATKAIHHICCEHSAKRKEDLHRYGDETVQDDEMYALWPSLESSNWINIRHNNLRAQTFLATHTIM